MDKIMKEKGVKEKLDFPKKLLFFNFSEKTIQDRRSRLENYLNKLAQLINLVEYPEACEFLEIESHSRTLLSLLDYESLGEKEAAGSERERSRNQSEDLTWLGRRKETNKIAEFLRKLNNEPLTIANTVQEFEAYYFDNSLQLTKKEIEQLLWGYDKLQGLLYYCGDAQNYIGGGYCMELFAKLIKYEYNSVEAEKFSTVFSATEPSLIRQMRLDHYVKNIHSHDNPGLLALFYYLKYNTHDITEPTEILEDKVAIDEYEKWIQNKITCGISA